MNSNLIWMRVTLHELMNGLVAIKDENNGMKDGGRESESSAIKSGSGNVMAWHVCDTLDHCLCNFLSSTLLSASSRERVAPINIQFMGFESL